MVAFSMQTEIAIVIADGREHLYDVWVDYDYHPGAPAYTPRGEYAPIDPPEPASAEIVAARWRLCSAPDDEKMSDCPGWLIDMMSNDDSLNVALIEDAEGNQEPDDRCDWRRDEPDEAQEWRDYDPDC